MRRAPTSSRLAQLRSHCYTYFPCRKVPCRMDSLNAPASPAIIEVCLHATAQEDDNTTAEYALNMRYGTMNSCIKQNGLCLVVLRLCLGLNNTRQDAAYVDECRLALSARGEGLADDHHLPKGMLELTLASEPGGGSKMD